MSSKSSSIEPTPGRSSRVPMVPKKIDVKILVNEVRNKILKAFISNPDDYDANDVTSFVERNEVKYIERFLLKNNFNVEKTIKMMCNCLKWRKSYGISKLADNSFPENFYKYGIMFIFGTDLDGDYLLHYRAKLYHVYHPALVDLFKKLFCHLMFKVDKKSAKVGKQWSVVLDLTDATSSQHNIALALWALTTYFYNFPSGLKKVIIYNPAWFAKPIINAVLKAFPHSISSKLEVVKKEKIMDYIAAEQLPKYYGGTNPVDPRPSYSNCVDVKQFFFDCSPETTDEELSKLITKYDKIIATTDW